MLKLRSNLNLDGMRDVYLTQGGLTGAQFDTLVDGTQQINALDLGGLTWEIIYLARDVHGHIPWSTHLQAWAVGLGQPYSGIEEFYRSAVNRGAFPKWFLNQTTFFSPPSSAGTLPIGRLMVRLGVISLRELQRALGIQMLIKQETGLPTRIGRILAATTQLSLPDAVYATALHLGVPYVSIEKTLPVIERVSANPAK